MLYPVGVQRGDAGEGTRWEPGLPGRGERGSRKECRVRTRRRDGAEGAAPGGPANESSSRTRAGLPGPWQRRRGCHVGAAMGGRVEEAVTELRSFPLTPRWVAVGCALGRGSLPVHRAAAETVKCG